MPKIKIDGIELEVEAGINLIEAANQAGIVIPHFCYHSKLPVAGNCRMCLVDIEGLRKPEIACNTQVRDGMVVYTNTPKVEKLRQGVLEFLFLNHPLDCPICDKAGECKLQDYYLEHGRYQSRLSEGKVRKPKRLDIGKHIILDSERCVLCSRCVRFTDVITKTGEMRIFERGSHSQIGIYPTKRIDNRYSICVTDICPVGALTSKEFRFSARVWYLEKAPSICNGCSNGCNIDVYHYRDQVHRFMPRRNDSVNDTWMCDDGRLSFKNHSSTDRFVVPLLLENSKQVEVTLDKAIGRVARETSSMKISNDLKLGVVLSPSASLEENYLLTELADKIKAKVFFVGGNPIGSVENDDDGFLIRSDKNPNTNGALMLAKYAKAANPGDLMNAIKDGSINSLIVLSNDIVAKAKRANIDVSIFSKLKFIIAADVFANETLKIANVAFPIASYLESDGTWVNFARRVQRFKRSVFPKNDIPSACDLIQALIKAVGFEYENSNPEKVFHQLSQKIPEMNGMTYSKLSTNGMNLADTNLSAT